MQKMLLTGTTAYLWIDKVNWNSKADRMHKDLTLQFGRTSMRIGDVSQVRQRKESKENKQEPSGSKCVPLIGSIFYLECNEKSNSKYKYPWTAFGAML